MTRLVSKELLLQNVVMRGVVLRILPATPHASVNDEQRTIGRNSKKTGSDCAYRNLDLNEIMEFAILRQVFRLSALHVWAAASSAFKSRATLDLENLALRHQIGIRWLCEA